MKVIIVEDESASQEYLKQLLEKNFNQLELVATADSVPGALAAIQTHNPDIVFMDIEIKLGSGFDVLAQITERSFEVIFTTAFNAFAIEAFRHHAIDYLLKPLNAAQVKEATERCLKRVGTNNSQQLDRLLQQLQTAATPRTKIGIHTVDGIEFVEIADIIYAEAKGNYTDLVLQSGAKITASKKLKEIEDQLPAQSFFRIHHSYIVNLQYVRKYHKGRGGYLVLQDGASLPVSSARKEDFLNWLG